ncbi:MAG: hypothetical protein JNK15_19065 [Planctomycetes bacterium]|nr:hypothetical protein [Planctomycetota bacterium]
MHLPDPVAATARTFLRAMLTGDRDLLQRSALPDPRLNSLIPAQPPLATIAPMLAVIERMPLHGSALAGDRWLVQAALNGMVHLLVVQKQTAGEARVDARYLLSFGTPDDDRTRVARSFYRAMLLGDLAALRELSFDPRGVELLAESAPPHGEHAQLEHIAATMSLIELGLGEAFTVPNAVQFVSARHVEMGIVVLSGLTPNGEIPFLLRQRDGAWRVIPFHFIQGAALARSAAGAP